jgi:hypothetical protein
MTLTDPDDVLSLDVPDGDVAIRTTDGEEGTGVEAAWVEPGDLGGILESRADLFWIVLEEGGEELDVHVAWCPEVLETMVGARSVDGRSREGESRKLLFLLTSISSCYGKGLIKLICLLCASLADHVVIRARNSEADRIVRSLKQGRVPSLFTSRGLSGCRAEGKDHYW